MVSADQPESFSDFPAEVFEAPAAIAEVELTAAADIEETVMVASAVEPHEGWSEVVLSLHDEPQPFEAVAMFYSGDEVTEPVTPSEVPVVAMADTESDSWTPVLIAGGGSGSGAPPRRPVAASASSGDQGRSGRSLAQERMAAHHSGAARRRGRRGLKVGVAGLTSAAMVAGMSGIAFANAANPNPDTTGTATVDTNTGHVSVNLSGTWIWPGQTCEGRYAEGFAVDWWGISGTPTPNPNFQLVSAPQVTSSSTTETLTNVPAAGYVPLGASYFHVTAHYDSQDINVTGSTCSDVQLPDPSHPGKTVTGSTGPWSASAVYPSVGDVPPQLCMIVYDEHGKEGSPSGSASDLNPNSGTGNGDKDNSIQTNDFNPNNGAGYCLSTSFVPSLKIQKTGPAVGQPNGTGSYTMTATNDGQADASSVTITDDIPTGETFQANGSDSRCSLAANADAGYAQTVNCPIGTVAAGKSVPVIINVAYGANTDGQTLTDCAIAANSTLKSNQSCVPTIIQQPQLVIVKDGPATGLPNHQGTYTMTATNNGTADAPDVNITDNIPAGETVDQSQLPNNCHPSVPPTAGYSATFVCSVGTLTAHGGHATVAIVVTYGADTAGQTLQDCAVAKSGTLTSNQDCVPTKIPSQTLSGHIYLCDNGNQTTTEKPGGTISFSIGGGALAAASNPFGPNKVDAGLYDVSAVAPSGYFLTNCGNGYVNHTQVNVPSGGTGTAIFYVSPNTTQTIAGHIFSCDGGVASGTEIPGGQLVAHTGTNTPISSANPLGPTAAAAATYTMNATAPSGYKFVVCSSGVPAGNPTQTVNSDTSATEQVVVPANGAGVGRFYVVSTAPLDFSLTKANNASNPTGNNYQQTEAAQTPGETFNYQAVIKNTSSVSEKITVIKDTLPAGTGTPVDVCPALVGTILPPGQSVTCTFTGVAPSTANASVTDEVSVTTTNIPGNPTATVTHTATSTVTTPSQTLQGHIYLCNNDQPTTAEVTGGTIAASGPQSLAAQPNPLNLIGVAAGTYTVNATAPAGFSFVICNGLGSNTATGHSATNTSQSVTVPVGGTGTAIFYVTPNTPGLHVSVVKTNNASDPNGTSFSQTQTAQTLGETFQYQAVISNTGTDPEVISVVTDQVPQGSGPTVNICNGTNGTNVIGQTLQVGQSVTCTFNGTAPTGSGDSLTDLVTVTTTNTPGNTPGTSTGTSTSTVLTTPTVIITKANDANGDGTFTQSETASATATSVPYQVVVTNNNAAPGTITALTDTVNGTTMNICPDLIGTVLQPGQTATCNFTGPVPSSPTTDTAGVTLSVNGILVTATAPSTVFPPVLGTTITNNPPTVAPTVVTPTQLAFTGAPVKNLVKWAGLLLLAGLGLLAGLSITDPRRRRLALVDGGWVSPSWSEPEASRPSRISSGLERASRLGRVVMGESRTSRFDRRHEGFRPSASFGHEGHGLDGGSDAQGHPLS